MPDWHTLLIEDTVDSAEVVETILEHHNISYTTAGTAEQALVILTTETPDIILVDLDLPGMNGWELLKRLRTNPQTANLPIIAITAYHSTRVADEAITAGFDAYFTKPLETACFVEELRRFI